MTAFNYPRLFKPPLDIGPVHVRNRIVLASMEKNYTRTDGIVTELAIAHYAQCAAGGVGWIDLKATFVDSVGRRNWNQIGIRQDSCVAGLRRLVEAVHDGVAQIGIELNDAGRNKSRATSDHRPVASSAVLCPAVGNNILRALRRIEIAALIGRCAQVVCCAVKAGLVAVELRSAHDHLLFAFLSPLTNLRTDHYDGSNQNLQRFGIEIVTAINNAVGDNAAVGCRLSVGEYLLGGVSLQDVLDNIRQLELANADYLSLSAGPHASFWAIVPPVDVETSPTLTVAAAIRNEVSVQVVAVGKFQRPTEADRHELLAASTPLSLFERSWPTLGFPQKARSGLAGRIVHCIGCDQECIGRESSHRDVTCLEAILEGARLGCLV